MIEDERDELLPRQGGTEDRRAFVNRFWDFVEGHILEKAFNTKMISWIVAVALFAIFLVAYNYSGMRKIRLISDNNTELQELRMEYITISTELMDDSRITSIEERVSEAGLPLTTPKTPPIKVAK